MREYRFVTAATTFRCRRCARCCSLDVMLSDSEMEALGEAADRKWRTTRKEVRDCKLVCGLLEGNLCGIYVSRPKLCRVYPFMAAPVAEFQELGVQIGVGAKRVKAGGDAGSSGSGVGGGGGGGEAGEGGRGEEYVVMYDELCPGVGEGGDGGEVKMGEVVALTLAHMQEMQKQMWMQK